MGQPKQRKLRGNWEVDERLIQKQTEPRAQHSQFVDAHAAPPPEPFRAPGRSSWQTKRISDEIRWRVYQTDKARH